MNWKGGITADLPAWLSKWQKEYRRRNPEQQKARDAVKCAIRNGKLTRGPCEFCGERDDVQAHHHNGYDEAHRLDVKWLCRTCHNKVHGKLGGLEKQEATPC